MAKYTKLGVEIGGPHRVPDAMSEILNDPRPIKTLCYDNEHGEQWSTSGGFTITAYGEPGEYCMLPWFKVCGADGAVVARIPAWKVTVIYA